MSKNAFKRSGGYHATASFGARLAPAETIAATELAELLHMAPLTLQRRYQQLVGLGMPRMIPGTKVWSRLAVRAWIDGAVSALPGTAHDPVEAARDALEARIADRVPA